jgi:hypothetical protein
MENLTFFSSKQRVGWLLLDVTYSSFNCTLPLKQVAVSGFYSDTLESTFMNPTSQWESGKIKPRLRCWRYLLVPDGKIDVKNAELT